MWKFEHVLAIILLLVLSAALFMAMHVGDKELILIFAGALTAAFGGVIAYFFTKHNPNGNREGDR